MLIVRLKVLPQLEDSIWQLLPGPHAGPGNHEQAFFDVMKIVHPDMNVIYTSLDEAPTLIMG